MSMTLRPSRRLLVSALISGILSPVASLAANVDASDAAVLADLLQELGYRAMLSTDGSGDPLILSSADGSDFRIYFYGCSNGQACKTIQFSRGYDMDQGMSLEQVNTWNREYRFGKVYLDDEAEPFSELSPPVQHRRLRGWSLD